MEASMEGSREGDLMTYGEARMDFSGLSETVRDDVWKWQEGKSHHVKRQEETKG